MMELQDNNLQNKDKVKSLQMYSCKKKKLPLEQIYGEISQAYSGE